MGTQPDKAGLIVCDDAREVLATFPAEYFHACITSSPYWGLRDYSDAVECVFGGDEGCEHEWGPQQIVKRGHPGDQSTLVGTQTAELSKSAGNQGSFCQRCSAWKGQFGLEPTPEMYVEHTLDFLRAIRRVLRKDGTCWLNLGDSYASSGGAGVNRYFDGREDSFGPGNRAMNTTVSGLKPKDLVMIPFRVALAAQADGAADPKAMRIIQRVQSALLADYDSWGEVPMNTKREIERLDEEYCQAHEGGWWVRSVIIWNKPNPMPESVRDRPTTSHEYVLLLTKNARYFYDADAIREVGPEWRGQSGTFARPNGKATNLEVPGQNHVSHRVDRDDRVPTGRNKRTVWTIATQPFKEAHFATFPEALVEPMILTTPTKCCAECGAGWERVTERSDTGQRMKMPDGWDTGLGGHGTFHRQGREKGEAAKAVMRNATLGFRPTCSCNAETKPAIILDPFAGRGTVARVARKHNRDWVMIEMNPDYIPMMKRYLALADEEVEKQGETWVQPRMEFAT